jgi:hypothetical protein
MANMEAYEKVCQSDDIYLVFSSALQATYPEQAWDDILHVSKPRNYWSDLTNQRKFFDELAASLHIHNPTDWNNVTTTTVESHGGTFLNAYYNGSLQKGTSFFFIFLSSYSALNAVYPELNIKLKPRKPSGYWKDQGNQREFLESLASKLGIQHIEAWNNVTTETVRKNGGKFIVRHYGGSLANG